ncbi:toxin-antitoxin system YwqK family antitoxin [Nocardia sp. MW-W600-9]
MDGQLIQEDEFDRSGGLHTRKRWDGTGALLADIDAAALAKPIRADAVDVDDEELESDPATGERRYRGAPFTGQTVEYFYPGGPIVQLTWYVDGFADGPDLSWHGDGARQFAGTAAAGRPIGLWLHWYPDGAPLRENVFNGNSVLMLRQEWDENGTRTGHTSDLPVPADDLVTFEAGDAELARDATTGRWDHRGEPFTGRLIERTGDAVETQDYRIGFPQGLFVRSEAGHVRRKGVRTPTGPIGAWYEWFPDGRIRQEDSYDLSHRLLLSRRFDELGVRIPASDKEDDAP